MKKGEFQQCVERLMQEWKQLPSLAHAPTGCQRHKRRNYQLLQQMIATWAHLLRQPRDEAWGKRVEDEILALMAQEDILPLSVLPPKTQEFFLAATKQFLRDALCFDEQLQAEEIFQALRNVWIFLLLELMCQRPLSYHKGIFAYSMLYPYTDNLLDDEAVSVEDKQQFNSWLTQRLQGEMLPSAYTQVEALMVMLEEQYPRKQYPGVYEGLLRIQEGQMLSLRQSQPCTSEEILYISIYKRGASVLADGLLMNGELSKEEAYFCLAYGFLLQLADDLQDVHRDLDNHHYTWIHTAVTPKQRQGIALHILSYVDYVLMKCYPYEDELMQRFILENCERMLMQALMEDRHRYPYRWQLRLCKSFPLRLKDYKAGKQKIEQLMADIDKEQVLRDYVRWSS